MKRRTRSSRCRTELMFQVASLSAIGSADGDDEVLEAVDMTLEAVAFDDGADPGWCARVNEISCRQRNEARKIRDRFGDGPNKLRDIALLPGLAVHFEPDRALADMARSAYRRDRGARGRLVEALAEVPGTAELLGLALEVAPRHVEPDGIAEDEVECLVDRHVAPAFGQRDHQLDLVLIVLGLGRIGDGAAAGDDGVGRLHEEERRLAVGVMAHLARMLGIVPADAIDAMDGKALATNHRNGGDGWRRDRVGHQNSRSEAGGAPGGISIIRFLGYRGRR